METAVTALQPGDIIQFFSGPNGDFVGIIRHDEFLLFNECGKETKALRIHSMIKTDDYCSISQLIAATHGLTARLEGHVNEKDHRFLLE